MQKMNKGKWGIKYAIFNSKKIAHGEAIVLRGGS